MQKVIFNTNGVGYWSDVAKPVIVTDIQVCCVDDELEFAELRVYFDTESWDVNKDGLIYTDKGFMPDLRAFLSEHGLAGDDVEYSEQGMQGDDYVSCDIGEKFLKSWDAKFGAGTVQKILEREVEDFKARWG